MEDLLQSQIQDSCRLALPNGLKELMSDISREVLRAQPSYLLKFITDYLSTLLITRDNLYVAARVCNAICECDCRVELEDELKYIGLDEKSASYAAEKVEKILEIGEVNEGKLLLKLANKTSIDESQVPAVLSAIRRAFLKHQRNHTQIHETSSSNSDEDDVVRATRHTLSLYRKTEPTLETFNRMAKKIQASYRAFKVRRETGTIRTTKTDQLSRTPSRSESLRSTDQLVAGNTDIVTSIRTDVLEKRKVGFGALDNEESVASEHSLETGNAEDIETPKIVMDHQKFRSSVSHLSSTSLAGSYLSLPRYKPYSAHDIETLAGLDETLERERSNYDYTEENLLMDKVTNGMTEKNEKQREKKMSFSDSPKEYSCEEDIDEFEDIAEVIEGEDIFDKNDLIEEDLMEEDIMENVHVLELDEETTYVYEAEDVAGENEEERETDTLDEDIVEEDIQIEIDIIEKYIKQKDVESVVLDEHKEELDLGDENIVEEYLENYIEEEIINENKILDEPEGEKGILGENKIEEDIKAENDIAEQIARENTMDNKVMADTALEEDFFKNDISGAY